MSDLNDLWKESEDNRPAFEVADELKQLWPSSSSFEVIEVRQSRGSDYLVLMHHENREDNYAYRVLHLLSRREFQDHPRRVAAYLAEVAEHKLQRALTASSRLT